MPRTSAAEVKEIVTVTVCDDVLLHNFIDTASLVVDEQLAANTNCVMSDARLQKIEMYLAAHFVALTERSEGSGAVKFTKVGDASESYETDALGEGLNGTPYGQTAVMLDTCGILTGMTNTLKKAQLRVV